MRSFLHQYISILLACCLSLQSAPVLGQETTPGPASGTGVQPVNTQEISKDVVISKFQELQQSPAIQRLDAKLKSLQFTPATDPSGYWGQTATYAKTVGGSTQSITGTIYIRGYLNPNSKDDVALGQVTLTSSSGQTKTYPFYLVAPNHDVTKYQEYTVVNNEVTLQHSLYSCVIGQLPSAGSACTKALATCSASFGVAAAAATPTPAAVPAWITYLICLGGGCVLSFVMGCWLCCECNGDWWCKDFVGNCSQGKTPWVNNDLTQLTAAPSAAPRSALDGYQTSNGDEHVNFIGTDTHVYELIYSNSKWAHNDLTQLSGAPNAVSGSALAGYQTSNSNEHVNYLGADNHVYELVYNGKWSHTDLTQAAGAPSAAPGSSLDGYPTSNGDEHVNFIDTDNHVYELVYNGKWSHTDLTQVAGAPNAAPGSALAGYQTSNSNEHVNYLGADNHVYELVYNGKWSHTDLTQAAGAPSAAPKSALDGYQTSNGDEHVNYIGGDNHAYELIYTGKWAHNDLTQLSGAPIAAPGSDLDGYQTSEGNEHVNYVSGNNHVYELVYNGKWSHTDLTQAAGAPSAAPESALKGYRTSNNNEHVNYLGGNNHVYELVYK